MKAAVVGFVWLLGCIGASDVDCANNPSAEVCVGRDGLESLFQSNKPILESLNLVQNGATQEGIVIKKHCWDIDCGALQRDHAEDDSDGWCEDVSDLVSKKYFEIEHPRRLARRWITRTSLDEDGKPFGKYYCETEKFEKINKDNVKLRHKYGSAHDFKGDLVVEEENQEEDAKPSGITTSRVANTVIDSQMWFMWITQEGELLKTRKSVADALGALRYWKHCLSVCCVADGCWRFMQRPQYTNERIDGYNFYWQKKSEVTMKFPDHYHKYEEYGTTKGPNLWKYPQQYCYEQNSQYVFCPYNHEDFPVKRPAIGTELTLEEDVNDFFTKQTFNDAADSTFFNLCCKLPKQCACTTEIGDHTDAECPTAKYASPNDWMNSGVEIVWPAEAEAVHAESDIDVKAQFLRTLYEDKLWGAAESFTIHPRHHDYHGRGRDLDR